MQVTIRKLMRTDMKVYQAHVCFNTDIRTNWFRRGIANYNDEQIKESK